MIDAGEGGEDEMLELEGGEEVMLQRLQEGDEEAEEQNEEKD